MLDHHRLTVAPLEAGRDDPPGSGGHDLASVGRPDVDAGVKLGHAGERVLAPAEGRCDVRRRGIGTRDHRLPRRSRGLRRARRPSRPAAAGGQPARAPAARAAASEPAGAVAGVETPVETPVPAVCADAFVIASISVGASPPRWPARYSDSLASMVSNIVPAPKPGSSCSSPSIDWRICLSICSRNIDSNCRAAWAMRVRSASRGCAGLT